MKNASKNVLKLPLGKRAEMAFKEAVEEVIDEHARLNLPLHFWREGRVVAVSPDQVRDLFRDPAREIAGSSIRPKIIKGATSPGSHTSRTGGGSSDHCVGALDNATNRLGGAFRIPETCDIWDVDSIGLRRFFDAAKSFIACQ